ncbi:MAG: hypothetical protein AAB599_01380 [Patescibacteria group bacterium]
MNFYKEVFSGELELQTVGETPLGKRYARIGDNVSICLVCESKEEAKEVFMPLDETPFETFAMITDKFGTEWMLQFDSK